MTGKRVSIRDRLRRYFMSITLIPIVIILVSFAVHLVFSVWNESDGLQATYMTTLQKEIDQLFDEAYQIGETVIGNDRITELLENREPENISVDEDIINHELSYVSRYFDSRVEVYIVGENGSMCKSSQLSLAKEEYRNEEWYSMAVNRDTKVWLSLSDSSRVVRSLSGEYAALAMPIRLADNNRVLGVALIEIDISGLLAIIADTNGKYYFLVPDRTMHIDNHKVSMYESETVIALGVDSVQAVAEANYVPEYISETVDRIAYWRDGFNATGTINAEKYNVRYTTIESSGWILVSSVPYLELYRVPIIVCCLMIVVILVMVALVIVFTSRASRVFTVPIFALNESVTQVAEGNFDIMIQKTRDDEIGDLTEQFNRMTRHVKRLMNRVVEEQTIKRKYELLLLQAQINPHFLYNTLDSIIWLIRMHRDADAEVMLQALISFFKTGLNHGEDTIPLQQEIENVSSYMKIQSYRYKTKISYDIDVCDSIQSIRVPKLILQPLVENAIYHGIKEKDGPGMVIINGYESENEIIISVNDDGLGMNSEQLDKLRKQMNNNRITNRDSYGVSNVVERLQLYFHSACSMTITSAVGQGTKVVITIGKENFERV